MSNALHFQNFLKAEIEEVKKSREGKIFDEFRPGDTVAVTYHLMQDDVVKADEKVEWRSQTLTGVCVGKHNNSLSSTFCIRKIQDQLYSFKRTFMLYSPMIQSIKVTRKGRVRRAKLNYLSKMYGKAARIKERR